MLCWCDYADIDDDIDRRCPACDAVMLPRSLLTGAVIDYCPNCGQVGL